MLLTILEFPWLVHTYNSNPAQHLCLGLFSVYLCSSLSLSTSRNICHWLRAYPKLQIISCFLTSSTSLHLQETNFSQIRSPSRVLGVGTSVFLGVTFQHATWFVLLSRPGSGSWIRLHSLPRTNVMHSADYKGTWEMQSFCLPRGRRQRWWASASLTSANTQGMYPLCQMSC